MDGTNSVSKGVFVFKNGAKCAEGRKKAQPYRSFLDTSITGQLWFRSFQSNWERTEKIIDKLQTSSYAKILDDLLAFVDKCHEEGGYKGVFPTAALLTGINQIDHLSQFEKLADDIRNNTHSMVVVLESRDGSNVKEAMETIVGGIIKDHHEDGSDDQTFLKNQLNLDVLQAWYLHNFEDDERNPNLTIILPDFELFNPTVLQDLILILYSYIDSLPIVFIFGVATAVTTIHNVLPYHVKSLIKLCIFQSEPSITNLNVILNEVLLTHSCTFHLSGKVFKFLVDIFLFYDFSVSGFVQGFKYAFMDHYFQKSINALSSVVGNDVELEAMISQLSSSELEELRQLPSFRPFVESLQHPQDVIDYLTNDDHLKRSLPALLNRVHNFWFTFHCALEILQTLVGDLPKEPLGKQLRELYYQCVSSDVTELPEFKECIQLLSFLSKEEMLQKIKSVLDVLLAFLDRDMSTEACEVYDMEPFQDMSSELCALSDELVAASHDQIFADVQDQQQLLSPSMGRQELREKLLTAAKHSKSESGVTRTIGRIVDYFVKNIFQRFLHPPNKYSVPLIELYMYNDISSIRRHIVGVPRAAIHTGLNNPQYYLQCECCVLEDSATILPSLPDLSIAYKLHLECGATINLYDWLQAFRTVIEEGNEASEEDQIDPSIQARFSHAVAELQFLGFIKTSTSKTDYVTRLTW